ncbi:hypothetical protein [Methylobacterium currus]|uniref:hypothetical protein n=2 Tax=Methylobacterium currus TaxID=2051553 RepID=UPI000F4FB6ED|nr:hypothetical protein [Methylobacterium currus]
MRQEAIRRPDLGVLAVGATAGLAVVDMTRPHLQPLHDPLRARIALANRDDIAKVVVDGRALVDEGRCLAGGAQAIVREGAAAIEPDAGETGRRAGCCSRMAGAPEPLQGEIDPFPGPRRTFPPAACDVLNPSHDILQNPCRISVTARMFSQKTGNVFISCPKRFL